MQRLVLCAFVVIATAVHAQLPASSPSRVGFDPARLEVLHATTKRLARDGKVADVQAYGYRDVERKLPMERNTICRIYSMSKINTDLFGALIERVSGKSFGAFLEERIFAPLGMKDTAFDVPPEKMSRLARTRIDPKEEIAAIAFAQHFPYNQHNFLSKFTTGYFQALK